MVHCKQMHQEEEVTHDLPAKRSSKLPHAGTTIRIAYWMFLETINAQMVPTLLFSSTRQWHTVNFASNDLDKICTLMHLEPPGKSEDRQVV